MPVKKENRNPDEKTKLQKFLKRITDTLSTLTCCIPWKKRNKVAPEEHVQEMENALKDSQEKASVEKEVIESQEKDSEAIAEREASPVKEAGKDTVSMNSLTKSEDEIVEQAVELALKASQSSALDDLL